MFHQYLPSLCQTRSLHCSKRVKVGSCRPFQRRAPLPLKALPVPLASRPLIADCFIPDVGLASCRLATRSVGLFTVYNHVRMYRVPCRELVSNKQQATFHRTVRLFDQLRYCTTLTAMYGVRRCSHTQCRKEPTNTCCRPFLVAVCRVSRMSDSQRMGQDKKQDLGMEFIFHRL